MAQRSSHRRPSRRCRFHRSLSFPDTVDAALRVEKVGNFSVTFAIALFGSADKMLSATERFIEVFTGRISLKSSPIGKDAHREMEGRTCCQRRR